MLLEIEHLLVMAGMALFVGFVKAGLPALGALMAVLVVLVFPPRDALGITLIYLLIGDCVAVSMYWRQAQWHELKKMVVPVLAGIAAGGMLLSVLDNRNLGGVIGLIVVAFVLMEPVRPKLAAAALRHPWPARILSGSAAGLATTIGNAAGPIMAIYFLVLNLDKRAFIGTSAIFFLFVNTVKIPVFILQDLFQAKYYASIALTAPLVLAGALAGKAFLRWIPQLWFNRAILFFTGLAGIWLLVNYFRTP